MNDHSAVQKMSHPPQLQPMMSQPPPVMNPAAAVPISVQPVLVQPQLQSMNPPPQLISQMAPAKQPPAPVTAPAGMNPSQPMFVAQRGYKPWGPQQQQLQNPNNNKFNKKNNNSSWKGKKVNCNKDRRMEKMQNPNLPFVINNNNPTNLPSAGGVGGAGGGYNPPSLNELQTQNRMKARKYYHPKKKFNDNSNGRSNRNNRFAPYAPRNTSSFIIRAKKAGGIAEMVSPCPVTPAVLPTPIFSPSREVLGDMAKEEWGVDGYGSMKGLIRLRSPQGVANEGVEGEEEDEEGNGSSESDVEEHVEVERRLDHDLSRFEMIYPSYYSAGGAGAGGEYSYSGYNNVLENRVDDQDSRIAQLEEENLTLKERLFLMERELGDLRRRLQFLERQQFGSVGGHGREYVNEEVVENVSENDENESDGGSDVGGGNRVENEGREEVMQYVSGYGGSVRDDINGKEEKNDHNMEDVVGDEADVVKPKVDDEMAGSGNLLTAVDESVKDGGLTDGVVANDAATKEDEAMGEHTVLENVIADPERDVVHGANAREEVGQDGMLAEKDGSKDE